MELLSASAQIGLQSSAKAAMVQVSVEGDKLTQADRKSVYAATGQLSADLVASKVEFGRHNSDGSKGFNAAASADLGEHRGHRRLQRVRWDPRGQPDRGRRYRGWWRGWRRLSRPRQRWQTGTLCPCWRKVRAWRHVGCLSRASQAR